MLLDWGVVKKETAQFLLWSLLAIVIAGCGKAEQKQRPSEQSRSQNTSPSTEVAEPNRSQNTPAYRDQDIEAGQEYEYRDQEVGSSRSQNTSPSTETDVAKQKRSHNAEAYSDRDIEGGQKYEKYEYIDREIEPNRSKKREYSGYDNRGRVREPGRKEKSYREGGKALAEGRSTTPATAAGPSWNIWLDRGGEIEQALELKTSYELVLDLSRYRYDSRLGTSISPEVISKIEKNCERKWLNFRVRPFSLDQKLSVTKHEDILQVKLDRLCGSPNLKDEQLIEQYRNKRINLPEVAKAVQGGQIKFSFVPLEPGCAVMALSIWDETGIVPLDHLVVTLPIAKPNELPPHCGSTGDDRITLTQGAGSLLRIALDRSADNPPPVASLSMFETEVEGDLHTVVILIERSLYEKTKGGQGVHTWLTEGLISNYLATQLLDQLNAARKNLDSESPYRRPYPYERIARELDIKLFSQYQGSENVAKYAREALLRAVNTAKEKFPTVLIRAVDAKDKRFLVPLGLLTAKIKTPIFTKSMTVITPLPVERYPAARACINTWTLAVPESLENDSSSRAELVEADKIVEFPRVKTEAELRQYVSDGGKYIQSVGSAASPSKAEGLILLAHHSPTFIWFQDGSERVASEQLKRNFPIGSVAVFAACSTASPEGKYQEWVTKLNKHGVDAMIVSPFPVLIEYATRFALNFGLQAQNARDKHERPSFLELFRAARDATSDKFKKLYGDNTGFNEMALEFVVAGDYSIRMCANP